MEQETTQQELHEDRSNHTKARNYIAGILANLLESEGTPLTELELRIASITAMMISQNGIVLTSLLGQLRQLETNLHVIDQAIRRLIYLKLVTIRHTRPTSAENNNVIIEFAEDMQWGDVVIAEVNRLTEFSYPLPSLKPTKRRTDNTDSGMYYSHSNVMAGHYLNRHTGDLNLSHLNALGQLRFKLNHKLMAEFDELDMMSDKAKAAAETYNANPEEFVAESQRAYAAMGDQAWSIDWFRCTRGRKYPRGYHISPHGTEFKKQSIEFAHKRVIKLK